MIRISPVSGLLPLWIIIGACLLVLLPAAAQAACARWDISGEWAAVQTNDAKPAFTLQQTDTQIQGSGHWAYTITYNTFPAKGDDYVEADASVDGTINGDSVEFTAYWSNDTIGVYSGKIGPQGRIEGTTYDRRHPETRANWYSSRTVTCLSADGDTSQVDIPPSSTTPHADDNRPPVALGRVQATTPAPPEHRIGNEPPICANARSARARNSPAASALEAQCRAAGGSFQDRAITQAPSDIRARNAVAISHLGVIAPSSDRDAPPPAAAPPPEAPRIPDDRATHGESFAPPLFDDGAQLWVCTHAVQDVARGGVCGGMQAGKAYCRAKGHSGALQQHRDGSPALMVGPARAGMSTRATNGDVCTANNCVVIKQLDCAQ